ncbi:MAG TPA: lipid-binding SYLF domain-containing protein [Gammaproteobacteria bacterium]|nr:lipid-binding SYLF domain-containing protein [Gammaproteobacteria bacterium]
MRTPTFISLLSAAALMGGVGAAAAGQPDMPSPNSYQQPQAATMNEAQPTEQIASNAASVLRSAGQAGQTGQQIPAEFISASKCIVVFPKSAVASGFFAGSADQDGRAVGVASCRDDDGNWSSTKPAFVKLHMNVPETDGSQTAAQTQPNHNAKPADHSIVLLFVDDDAADDLMGGDMTLGDDADVAPGPTGQSVDTTNAPAAVLAYSSTMGSGFSGAQLEGATIGIDEWANEQAYGEDIDPTDLLEGDYDGDFKKGIQLTAYNQALAEFAPASQYKSKTSIAR